MLANYHTHTDWSDGQASMSAMIDAARDAGFAEYGVSDHWTLHPAGETFWWSMQPDRLRAYLDALDEQQRRIGRQLVIRKGLEIDWFDGFGDSIAQRLAPFTFDYLIGAVHFVGASTVDESTERWEQLDQAGVNAVHREFWRLVHDMARSGLFDIAAHLDVVKKFAFLPDV
ncbi:MAG: PHP domain-containing protein, partial [Phycisphaerales bacterium]|nr:PHP domain-containing protein [Phycisphaerales bacterium]